MSGARSVLPTNVRPTHYHLAVTPDLEKATFTADVSIDVAMEESTDMFTFNAVGLTFTHTSVHAHGPGGTQPTLTVLDVTTNAEDQRMTIKVDRPVSGAVQLRFSYSAAISDNLFGFYRSHYVLEGVKKYVGATQFCPAEARRVFPCWDEPAIKATFALDIVAPSSMQVWSNDLPSLTVAVGDGSVRWSFRPLSPMSTYLVAWVLGEMETAEVVMLRDTTTVSVGSEPNTRATEAAQSVCIRAVTPRGKIDQAAFAISVAAKVLRLYEDYFRRPYVFPKLDLVALPNFAFGAMENWGCITFREQTLLTAADASETQKERVAMVVAHELAHQWFGNLATMAWWSDLWLNESFATYMATWAVHKLFPDWVVDTQFVYDEGSRAFQLDALRSSHAIELPVRDVREVDGIFDAISYSKGAMVLRMTAKYIGEDGFQRGLVNYLSRYAYASATSLQLWECLSGPTTPNLKEVLHAWTREQGYPYVQAAYDASTQILTMEQHRFLVMQDATEAEDQVVWHIPMYYTYGDVDGQVKTEPLLMTERRMTVTVPGAAWVKVNSDQIAFCRVMYAESMLAGLMQAVTAKSVSGTDRYSIMADLAAFAKGGYCRTTQALSAMAHYSTEGDYTVWCEVAQFERRLRNILCDSPAKVHDGFNEYCRRLYSPAMQRIGYQRVAGEGYRCQQMQLVLFQRLVAAGEPAALATARSMYAQRGTDPIPADMLGMVYSVHLREGGDAALAEIQQLITEANSAEARTQYLNALSAVSSSTTGVPRVMDFLLSDAVSSQDVSTGMHGLAEGPQTQRCFVELLMSRWTELAAKVPSLVLARILKFVEYGCDSTVGAALQNFFDALPADMQSRTQMTFQQGMEGLRCNAAWRARDAEDIAAYLLQT